LKEIKELRDRGRSPFLLSTGSLIGEGFDMPELSALVLAMPISFKGRIIQYAGRIHRENPGKMDVAIYDYVDVQLGSGRSMFRKRLIVYKKMGYTIKFSDDSKLYGWSNQKAVKIDMFNS
jgi:superfamily II DNA or RNA helicase